MCGIVGLVTAPSRTGLLSHPHKVIELGLSAIKARGPDSNGTSRSECGRFQINLGHTRLSIMDLSDAGSQPMEDGRYVLSYNGEIYNFVEIREELKSLGYFFISNSDTEVLFKSWIEWGVGCLEKFNGMFAFAMLDKVEKKIWLIRDRFGVKPIFWSQPDAGSFIFSSSSAFLAKTLSYGPDLDYCGAAIRYKVFETCDRKSAYQGVNALGPGCLLVIDLSSKCVSPRETVWYDIESSYRDNDQEIFSLSHSDLSQKCITLLEDAVKIRLRSDVPVAVSLSGGVDSSSIAAIAAGELMHLEGFSFGSPQDIKSEGPLVDSFAKDKGIPVEYIYPKYSKNELVDLLEKVCVAQEAPFSGLSVMAQSEVYNRVSQKGYKVLLGGQGGDEAFAGYRKFFLIAIRSALRARNIPDSLSYIFSLCSMLTAEYSQKNVYLRALKRYSGQTEDENLILNLTSSPINLWGKSDITFSERQVEDIRRWSIPSLLRYEDRNSMFYGVESRLPFMDYRLIEFGLSLPAKLKIKNGFGKWILRDAIKNYVPNAIRLNRMKRGFDVTQTWLRDGLALGIRETLLDNRSLMKEYFLDGIDLEKILTEQNLTNNPLLLDEAIMLFWLVNIKRT